MSESTLRSAAANSESLSTSRREFLIAGTGALIAGAAPAILGAADKSGTRAVRRFAAPKAAAAVRATTSGRYRAFMTERDTRGIPAYQTAGTAHWLGAG